MALLDSSRKEQASVQYFSEQESYGGIDPGHEPPNARVQIEKALEMLMRQKWLVIGTFGVFVLAAIGFSFAQNPEYEAYTSILVDLGSSPKNNEEISVRVDDPFARNDWSLDAELFILQSSNTITERVANRLVRMRDTASTALNLSILYSEEGEPLNEVFYFAPVERVHWVFRRPRPVLMCWSSKQRAVFLMKQRCLPICMLRNTFG